MATETKRYDLGAVIRKTDPEPEDGTPLLGPDGRVEPYVSADVGGRWRDYAGWAGPFVVAPDYNALVNGR
jgi:hypothetical protein